MVQQPLDSSTSPPQLTNLRTCNLCRQRKVKCDRQQPCSNCVKAGATCVHPPGPGRAAKRPRQAVDDRVLDRLSQLEATIRRLQHQAKESATPGEAVSRDGPLSLSSPPAPGTSSSSSNGRGLPTGANLATEETSLSQAPELGRLVVEESHSLYVGNAWWADMTESIEQLRGMFLEKGTEDEDPLGSSDSPLSNDEDPVSLRTNAAVLGYRSLAHSLQDFHPPVELAMGLYQLFSDRVSPVSRVFHMPTLSRLFRKAVVASESLDRETEALLFAVYYAAVISLDSDQCVEIMGAPRSATVDRFRFATEQALARANYLTTRSTLLLQAALLYLAVLRSDDATRAVSSLTALAMHIARSMGLHRDGTPFNLSPFETEMRRRIWYQVCLLDHRSNEHHGGESILTSGTSFNTRWPLNVNDSEISPDMTEFPPESDGFTDMSLALVRCHAMQVNWKLNEYLKQSPGSQPTFQDRIRIIDEYAKWNENYVKRCDPAEPLQFFTREISHIIVARIRVITYYCELKARKLKADACAGAGAGAANHNEKEYPDSDTLRHLFFAAAVDIVKRSYNIIKDQRLAHWAWHSHTYFQWQILAFVLSEICTRPPSALCDEAWEYAKAVYDKWLSVKVRDSKERGNIFVKPMGLLMAEAQRVRDAQRESQAQIPISESGMWYNAESQIAYHTAGTVRESLKSRQPITTSASQESRQAGPSYLGSATEPSLGSSRDGPPMSSSSVNSFDPFLATLPDDVQNAWFESFAQESANINVSFDPNDWMPSTQFFSFT
ncbi:hypothetical protein GGS20DRAFT_549021 [Poronia punctata]|nr:hypothetical protein GGS20DRAFT_549021 [Poronia punctata]